MPKKLTTQEFIERSTKAHDGKYDYSKVEYVNNRTKACIICPVHGEFWQGAGDHLKGFGCGACSGTMKLDTSIFVEKARLIHGDKYDYSKVEYKKNDTKVCIICPIHGEFWQRGYAHTAGHGCSGCKSDKSKINNSGYRIKGRKVIYGHGINDLFENIDLKNTKSYHVWRQIFCRCYDEKRRDKNPTYAGCNICDKWKYFSNFKKWFDEHYVEGYHLDKDILVKGNRTYSPEACCFVPIEINSLFNDHGRRRSNTGITGVCFCRGKYHVTISKNGENRHIGLYENKNDAKERYKKEKEAYVKEKANEWKDRISPDVYEALMKYEISVK